MKQVNDSTSVETTEKISEILEIENNIQLASNITTDVDSINEAISFIYTIDNNIIDLKNYSIMSITPANQLR